MRITSSTLQTQSGALSYAHQRREESLDLSVRVPASVAHQSSGAQETLATPSSLVELSGESLAAQDAASKTDGVDPRLRLIISLIETLTGEKIHLFDPQIMNGTQPATESSVNTPAQPSSSPPLEWSIHVESRTIREEAQQTNFQSQGSITTADGRKIDFKLELAMLRYERTESSSTFDAGNIPKKKDPLVLNLSTDQVRLTGETIAFDLNVDGKADKLATLAAGSGYLVLDRNKNGKIDDGSELFGPVSGDGFSDLKTLDSDDNGWIDENDPAFSALAVWRPGENNLSLVDAGVGAIALENRATPFTLKTNGTEGGNIRTTGVFLTEEGVAKTIQQIDLVA